MSKHAYHKCVCHTNCYENITNKMAEAIVFHSISPDLEYINECTYITISIESHLPALYTITWFFFSKKKHTKKHPDT